MRLHSAFWLFVAVVCVGLSSPAAAHQTSLSATLIAVDGSVSPVKYGPKTNLRLSLSSGNGGKLKFKLKRAVDAGGNKITALGNTLRMEVILNGVPQSLQFPFDIINGNGKIGKALLGLVRPDIIEILEIVAEDQGGEPFATLGLIAGKGPTKALASAIVQVEEGSFIRVAPTRDSDISIKSKKGGELHVRFDKLRDALGEDINASGNRLELELAVNGVAPIVETFFFDIINDSGEVDENLGLTDGDVVEVLRADVYDPNGDRFATLGVRIQNP